jgi:hypothetical protein
LRQHHEAPLHSHEEAHCIILRRLNNSKKAKERAPNRGAWAKRRKVQKRPLAFRKVKKKLFWFNSYNGRATAARVEACECFRARGPLSTLSEQRDER